MKSENRGIELHLSGLCKNCPMIDIEIISERMLVDGLKHMITEVWCRNFHTCVDIEKHVRKETER